MLDYMFTSDIEDCLKSMQAMERYGQRKWKALCVSIVANSSVTIPSLGIVINTYRSLKVRWIPKQSRNSAATGYASNLFAFLDDDGS